MGVFSTPFVAAPSLFTNDVVWTFSEVHTTILNIQVYETGRERLNLAS
jgi:hypothetical protein